MRLRRVWVSARIGQKLPWRAALRTRLGICFDEWLERALTGVQGKEAVCSVVSYYHTPSIERGVCRDI